MLERTKGYEKQPYFACLFSAACCVCTKHVPGQITHRTLIADTKRPASLRALIVHTSFIPRNICHEKCPKRKCLGMILPNCHGSPLPLNTMGMFQTSCVCVDIKAFITEEGPVQ